ncbi:MAG: hypothetical protein ABIP94_05790 [Planctomycetota bacterium]
MNSQTFFIAFSLALQLAAQDHLPSPIQAVGKQLALADSAGLQTARDGAGLRGGGADYRVHFTGNGMRFEPALGKAAPETAHLALVPTAVRRGEVPVAGLPSSNAPTADACLATYTHAPGVEERYDVRPEGVELSWRFAQPLAGSGDLVVRYAVDSSLGAPRTDGRTLVFAGEHGGVRVGGVTGLDARGRSVDGGLQWIDGGLEMSLPASFVATATYPIVLDPLIGTIVSISSGLTYADGAPDAAYDATTNRFLVVWQRTFSASNVDVRGQLVTAGGSLVGTTIFFGSAGVASPPRVANLGVRDRFGVVWTQLVGSTSTVELQTVEAGNGALTFSAIVATSTTSQFQSADIGSQCEAPIGTSRGFVIIYEDNDVDAIRARRYWFNAADTLLASSAFSVFTDVLLGSTYVQPAIARTASDDGRLLVVARRKSTLFTNSYIEGAAINAGNNTVSATGTIASSSANELFLPDVDGYASRWVVAWERSGMSAVYDAVRVAPVFLDGGTGLLTGTFATFGGSLLTRASAPTVGYTPGRTWLGYQNVSTLPSTSTTLRVAAIDSGSCANCNDPFIVPFPDGTRIVVATMTSGGLTTGEDALAVYHDTFDDVNAQLLRNYGTSGGYSNLGGACGASGFQSFSHSPGIGSSGLRNTLAGLPATTLAAIFNFSPPTTTSACGPCVWTPFSVTLSPPILSGTATVEFGIPCLASLVGQQFETQWTTIDFSQAPCPFFPGLTNSNRLLMTIGQ